MSNFFIVLLFLYSVCRRSLLCNTFIMFLDEGIDIPPKSPIDLRSSSFAPRHSLQAHSALGLASVEKGGLGPASQEKVVLQRTLSCVIIALRMSSFFVVQYLHYVFR